MINKNKASDPDENLIVLQDKNLQLRKDLDLAASITETDKNGVIIYANEKFCEISGYSLEELVGKNHNIVNSRIHNDDFWGLFWNTIKNGIIWKGEVCNRSKGGELYWVDSTVIPRMNSEGEIIGYGAIRIDISEKKKSESLIIHASKLASIGELSASIAHEIANPLAIINLGASGIKKELIKNNIESERIESFLSKIKKSVENIDSICRGMTEFSRKDVDEYFPIDVVEIMKSSLNLFRDLSNEPNIVIEESYSEEPIMVLGGFNELKQVFINMLKNSSQAFEDQKDQLIGIKIFKEDGIANICIKDNGSGIDEEVLPNIFDSFFTTKKEGVGTGLGLGISKNIIEKMNGKIEVESTVGEGTEFRISIPISD